MFQIGFQMLVGDRGKYLLMVGGLFFATVLMLQQLAIFCGLLRFTYSTISAIRAPIWITDPNLEEVNQSRPLRETEVFRVRSVPGVAWASPVTVSFPQVRLIDGTLRVGQVIGVDPTTLAGLPDSSRVLAGRLDDLWLPNAVIIDEVGTTSLSTAKDGGGKSKPVRVGDSFEINDREARVVAIVRAEPSLNGAAYVFTTYARAVEYSPASRLSAAFLLAGPSAGLAPDEVANRIRKATGLYAATAEGFRLKSLQWQVDNSGLPVAFGSTVGLGVIVGLVIVAQTFYGFVLDNLKNIASLKAMGASDARIGGVLLGQAGCLAFIGFGLGSLATAGMGFAFTRMPDFPFFLPWQAATGVAMLVMGICLFAALIGIAKVRRTEPFTVFRT